MDLEGVTDELYGAPPEQFTARRDELARQAGAEGDKALAAAVRALRRPTAAAWVVNHLVREDSDAVEALVGLGERMREAQSTLSGAQMRALSRERQSMLRELVRHATALSGGSVSALVTVEVEQTLRAVLADEDASAAVRSGCLTHGLAYSGLGPAGAGATGRHLRAVPGPAGDLPPTRRGGHPRRARRRGTPSEREVTSGWSERELTERESESGSQRTGSRRTAPGAGGSWPRRSRRCGPPTARQTRPRPGPSGPADVSRRRRRRSPSIERAFQEARDRAAAAGSAAGGRGAGRGGAGRGRRGEAGARADRARPSAGP